jgi:hypothetical protein
MERSVQRRTQYVGLPTACAVVYSHVSGQVPDARQPATMQVIFNDVARALASLVPIYVSNPQSDLPPTLAAGELLEGRFARGAHVFVSKSGAEVHGLAVQRGDMWSAIAILKSTGIRFARRDNRASE